MKRENNIDLMKIISAVLVIMTHVSAYYVIEYLEKDSLKFSIGNFYDSLSRVAVPLFVMVAGRYALSDDRNINFKEYYKKILKKIYIPTIIWSCLYFIYNMILEILKFLLKMGNVDFLFPIKSCIIGAPYFHLWYLYMMIGVYLLVPYFINLKKKYGERKFLYFGIIFILIALINISFKGYLDKINFYKRDDIFKYLKYYWYFAQFKFLNFLGYFILGYSLKNIKINLKKLMGVYLISFISLYITVEKTRSQFFYENNFIFVVLAAISLYMFFNNIEVKYNFSKLEKHNFNIYLVHAGILSIINIFLRKILKYEPNPIWYIPFGIVLVFLLSLIFSIILEKILMKIKKK